MKTIVYRIFLIFFLIWPFSQIMGQEVTVLPGGVLQKGIQAVVTGDYVRIRTGPSLKSKIIAKVNHGTEVVVLARGENLESIKGKKNYWYKIRIITSGIEGWMFGAFLAVKEEEKKKIEVPQKPAPLKEVPRIKTEERGFVSLTKLGEISQPKSIVGSGDLTHNGNDDLIFIHRGKNHTYKLTAYELKGSQFVLVYTSQLRMREVLDVSVYSGTALDFSVLVVSDSRVSYLWVIDEKTNALRLIYKTNSPHVRLGSLDGEGLFMITLKPSGLVDYDGTKTFFLNVTPVKVKGRHFLTDKAITYTKPLPVKKVLYADLDSDGKDEIVCEIGGKESGGGINVFTYDNGTISRIINTGFTTYNGKPFIAMWNVHTPKITHFVIYTTNPDKDGNVDTEFGFLIVKMSQSTLVVQRFFPINKLLDDINNRRVVISFALPNSLISSLILDYDKEKGKYIVKRPFL